MKYALRDIKNIYKCFRITRVFETGVFLAPNTRCILIVCKRLVISNLLTLRRKMDNEKRQNAL